MRLALCERTRTTLPLTSKRVEAARPVVREDKAMLECTKREKRKMMVVKQEVIVEERGRGKPVTASRVAEDDLTSRCLFPILEVTRPINDAELSSC